MPQTTGVSGAIWRASLWVVSWILPVVGPVPGVVGVGPAGGVAWNPQTHNLCVGAGLGASAGHNAAIGPLLTSSGNVDRILSGWSVSGGGNLPFPSPAAGLGRSEEHTSELQSLTNLVCRLLLEKKKK